MRASRRHSPPASSSRCSAWSPRHSLPVTGVARGVRPSWRWSPCRQQRANDPHGTSRPRRSHRVCKGSGGWDTFAPPVAEADSSPIGRWRNISDVVRALAETADTTDPGRFTHLVLGLTEPVRKLDDLTAIAELALDCDKHALCELRIALDDVLAGLPERFGDRLAEAAAGDCGCASSDPRTDPPEDELEGVIDQRALSALVVRVVAVYARDDPATCDRALDALLGLTLAAGVLGGLWTALRRGGQDELVRSIERLGALPQPMPEPRFMAMSAGGLPPGGLPPGGLPPGGLPPHVPGDPDDMPPGLGHIIDDLLGRLRKKRKWDPDDWDPRYPWWRDPIQYIDPREIERIRCLLELHSLMHQSMLDPAPVHVGPVTWSTGISGVTQSGACGGDTLTIRGSGFGNKQPANVVVLVPTQDGCRPAAVESWSNKRIIVTLPGNVSSGPVGFGDGSYIAAYGAGAARQTAIAEQIRQLWCVRVFIPLIPPFGECPPATAFNHVRAGAAVIKAFTANWQSLTVVEPTDPITLRWTVDNADQIRIERVSATGPTFAGATSVVDPAGTSYTLPPPSNPSLSTYAYRLTATGPCGTATADVTVVAAKRPRLAISSLEVTQSIQTPSQSVRLVEYKPTVVRVSITHGLAGWGPNAVPNVTGRIRVRRGAIASGWFDAANGSSPMAATPGASITVPASPQRNNTNDTLNFLIPPAWCTGTSRFELEVRVDGYSASGGFPGYSQLVTTTSTNFTFEHRRTLELRYIRVNWGGNTPTAQNCFDTLRTAVPLLPTSTANISALAGVGVQASGGTTDSNRDDLIDDFDDRHNCSWWEALWEWLGADCPDDDGAIWVLIPGTFERGRAKDIPSNTCFTPPNNGPYAAHELSHCLDQKHVGVMCANGQQATGGDPPSDFPNNAKLVDVPFDVTRNVALSLAGTGVFDVMTYCGTPNNTWPMPVRWQRLWDQVGS